MQTINEIPQNILVIQQRQIGDVVVTTPVFETVKKAFPKAKLTFLTEQKCVPLVEKDPWLDEILAFPKNKGVLEQLAFYWSLHKKNFDVLADLQQLPRCQLATLFSGAKYRLSFVPRHEYKRFLYTHCEAPEHPETDYKSFSKIRIFSPLGIVSTEMKPRIYLTEEEKQNARELLDVLGITENTPFITLDATHKHPSRRWKYYDELVRAVLREYPQFKFFIVRAPGEENQVRHLLKVDPKRVVMPEKPLSIRESLACMSYASFHIGNISAPVHMAVALNVPNLCILAETEGFWHFSPKNPPKGTARQVEARLSDEAYQAYAEELDAYNKGNNPSFVPVESPLLNCITVENVMEKFAELVKQPFYE